MTEQEDEALYNQQKDWEHEQEYYASESAKAEADIKAQEEREMDKIDIEEVKRILRRPDETVDLEPPYRCLPIGSEEWINQKARQIYQLFEPKPDEGLLTPSDVNKAWWEYYEAMFRLATAVKLVAFHTREVANATTLTAKHVENTAILARKYLDGVEE